MNQRQSESNLTNQSRHTWQQSAEAREAETKAFEAQERERSINLKAFGLSIAVILAPLLALLFGVDEALFMLALALLFTAWVTWSGANRVAPVQRSKLRVAAVFNGVMALLALGLLLLRVFA
jgi:uncharacterized membrane protein